MRLSVNTTASNHLTDRLKMLHRSGFPSAVRNTLNDAAFDMKKTTILKSAKENFKVKQPTFFKKHTGAEKAKGFNLQSMKAVVGFLDASDKKVRAAISGMEKQEYGGTIDDGLRYLKYSRGGGISRKVQKKNYYDSSKVVTGRSRRGGTRKSKFVARMFRALKEDKSFFMNTMKGNFLVSVKSASSTIDGKLDFKLNFLMMDRRIKKSKIKKTQFNKEASIMTINKMDEFYKKNAEYQFRKLTR